MNINKILKVIAIISCFLTIAQLAFYAFLKYKYALDFTGSNNIGIIGSADGPTKIFVAAKTSGFITAFLKSCPYLAIISISTLLVRKIWHKSIT